MKRVATLLLSLVLVLGLVAGCAPPTTRPAPTSGAPATAAPAPEVTAKIDTPARQALNVVTIKGPTGMGMAHLMASMDAGETAVDYSFTLAAAPDEISGKIATGEADIAAAPINLASALYNKLDGGVVLLAVNTLGVLYILEYGEDIQGIQGLAGKTLYATGQGATPEYILNYLLDKNGLTGAADIVYMAEHAELAALLVAGEVDYAMLPEPNVTSALMNRDGLRIALDLTEEWNKVSPGTKLVQGCIIARREVVNEKPEAVAAFLEEYAKSARAANEDIEGTAALIERYDILPNAAIAGAALPKSNIVCITGEEMAAGARAMLEVLFAAESKSIGGALPADDFYYMP